MIKLHKMVYSSKWPVSAFEDQVINIEEEEVASINSLLDNYIDVDLNNKSILNISDLKKFSQVAASRGYSSKSIKDIENNKSQKFDVILCYNIIDHSEDPSSLMIKIKSLCHKDTVVFFRFHPFFSPHAIYQYNYFNKAYLNVFFSERELSEIFDITKKRIKIYNYVDFINSFGFELIKKNESQTYVDKFLKHRVLNEKIEQIYEVGFEYIHSLMNIEYIDIKAKIHSRQISFL